MSLTLIQFFVGGSVVCASAFAFLLGSSARTHYDGALSVVGTVITAVIVAVSSMVSTMILGLPLRVVPQLRSVWLSRGEVTVAVALLGFVGCVVVIASAPWADAEGLEIRHPDARIWVLLTAWLAFCFAVAHFVWPESWRRGVRPPRDLETAPAGEEGTGLGGRD